MRNLEVQSNVFIRPSDYVDAHAVIGAAKVFTVPALAKYMRLAGTTDYYYKYGSTTVSVPTDVTDGTAGALVPNNGIGERYFVVTAGDNIAVNTGSTTVTTEITAEYWRI